MSLRTQVWVKQLVEKFHPDTSFLKFMKDFTALVDNDKINIAEAGIDPEVYVNNNTYPLGIEIREDIPHTFELDKFETKNTLVLRSEVIEFSYDQLESVLMGHRKTLRTSTGAKGAHAIAPAGDTPDTPVIPTTGDDNGEGKKRLKVEDVLRLKNRYDALEAPKDGRYLVLHPNHVEYLILHDLKAFKDITDFVNGVPKRFAGFNILEFTRNAKYNKNSLEKVDFSAPVAATDTFSSFSYHRDEVMKADGSVHMYRRDNDPELRGTVVGFDKRFICMPIRNKALGAIVSVDA